MSPLLGEGWLQVLTLSSLTFRPSALAAREEDAQSEAEILRIEQAVKLGM